jgi:uncharacterized cofD-like protein
VPGVSEALRSSKAKKIYVCNLVNKPGQTDDFTVEDYVDELERMAGGQFLDYVIYNAQKISPRLLELYAADGELPVELGDKQATSYTLVGSKLIAGSIKDTRSKSDPLATQRTLIRHDPDRVARQIMKIYFS